MYKWMHTNEIILAKSKQVSGEFHVERESSPNIVTICHFKWLKFQTFSHTFIVEFPITWNKVIVNYNY